MPGAWEPAALTGAGREPALDGGHEGGEIIRRTSCLTRSVESSCEWNWEERLGEKEGGRDEAGQPQKRWEPHTGRNRVGERPLHWVWFQTLLGREDRGLCKKRWRNQNETSAAGGEVPSCVTGRITCQFEGLSGACEGRCVLEVKLQVSPRPSSLASTFMTLVKLRLWGTHSLLSWANSPAQAWWTLVRSSPLAFGSSLMSLIILSGFCSSSPPGQPVLQPKGLPKVQL